MNERIKELSKQAFEYTLDRLNSGLEFRDFQPVWTEKFAELIVRECIDVCENGWEGEFTICGIIQCVEDLKNHFGVEE